jgi:hypothetical protein
MIGTRSLAGVGALAALLAVVASARAQEPGGVNPPAKRDPIAAEALFTRGKQLIEQGKTSEACDAFRESQKLDPAGGTLLRLALCHEAEGKLASAWLEFTEVLRLSQGGDAAKLAERVKIAKEHLSAIEPRLPKLVVNVDAASRVDGLSVTANGSPRSEATWGVPLPVDAGDVTIDATAPGHQAFRTVVHAENGKQVTAAVPALEVSPAASPGPQPGKGHIAGSSETSSAAQGSSLRPIGLVVGAVGVLSAGIGTYFGVTAMSKWNQSNTDCPGGRCSASGAQEAHDAKTAASIADVTIGIGAAAIITGAVLYFVGAPKNVQARIDGVAVTF